MTRLLGGGGLLLLMPLGVAAQGPRPVERWAMRPAVSIAPPQQEARERRSAVTTILTHTGVGIGAGLIIGAVLSGASRDDKSTVVLTWTAVGAVAGAVSGVLTWLVDP